MTDTVDKLIIESELQGGDATAAGVNKISGALDGVTVASDNVEKSTTSIENKFAGLERRLQTTQGQADQYAKIQTQVNLAVAQNPALQDRANAVLDAAKEKYINNGKELGHLDEIGAVLESRMAGLGNSMGLIGQVLQVIGPFGLAAGVGLGALAVALNYVTEQANRFGESSIHFRNVADAAGLTTTEVRGLSEAAEKAGVSGDSIASSFERFTANLESARTGTGSLFDSIAKINPALAVELASTRDGATAWDILAKAIAGTTDATTRAALAKASFGREGVTDVPVLLTTDQSGGIKAYSEEVQKASGITDELTRHTAQLKAEIDATKKQTADVYASIYSDDVLERQAKFEQAQLRIAQSIRDAVKGAAANGGGPATDEFGNPFDFTLLNANKAKAAQSAGSPAAPPGDAGNTEALKAADSATKELTQSTGLLRAAQINADEAARSLANTEASGAASASALKSARTAAGDALEVLANAEKSHISALNGAATGAEILQQRTDALTAAFEQGKISAEDYDRALHGDTANTIAALQDQRSVIEATGGAMKMAAQEAADYNAMLRAGKDPADALAIAAEKLANSEAAATKTANDQVKSLKDQTKMIEAVRDGTEATTAAAIAYKNAIDSGADAEAAAALSSATLARYAAQAAASTDQMAASAQAAAESGAQAAAAFENAARAAQDAQFSDSGGPNSAFGSFTPANQANTGNTFTSSPGPVGFGNLSGFGAANFDYHGLVSTLADQFVSKGDFSGAIKSAENLKLPGFGPSAVNIPDISGDKANLVDTLTQLKNAQTNDNAVKTANLQDELAWLETQPETIARDQKIVSLQQSIDQLKGATTANTAALNNLNTPGNTSAYADPLLHTELMSGGDTNYAKYFYQNPTAPAPVQMKDPGPAANSNTTTQNINLNITVPDKMTADDFTIARAQVQRAIRAALS